MPAVVRVKRRIDEEPLGAFVLNGKKRRMEGELDVSTEGSLDSIADVINDKKDEVSTILKFAGTMKTQDDGGTISQLARLSKDEAKKLVQQKSRKPNNHTERARQEMRQSLHENRFRVVNCLRTTIDAIEDGDGGVMPTTAATAAEGGALDAKAITIVDIEKHAASGARKEQPIASADNSITAGSNENAASAAEVANVDLTQPSDSDSGYVYDLYIPENEQQAAYVDLMDDNYLSVHPFDDLIYEDRYNNRHDDDDDEFDSEDSNQENHINNDYPDEEDSDRSCNEESNETRKLRRAVAKFVFDDNDEDENDVDDDDEFHDQPSSDDEDHVVYSDPYVHDLDIDEDDRFVNDIDTFDVDRYGNEYARYKARVVKRLKRADNDRVDDDDDDDDDDNSSVDELYHSVSETDD